MRESMNVGYIFIYKITELNSSPISSVLIFTFSYILNLIQANFQLDIYVIA